METDYKHCMTVFDDVFKIDFIVWKLIRPGSTASSRLSVYNRLYSMETMNWKLC